VVTLPLGRNVITTDYPPQSSIQKAPLRPWIGVHGDRLPFESVAVAVGASAPSGQGRKAFRRGRCFGG